MPDPFVAFGKQVKRGKEHFADARDEAAAELIVSALNRRLPGRVRAGQARAAALTPERRKEIAQAAAKARWGKS